MSHLLSVRRLTVLVVDDCTDTTSSFAMLLQAWGHAAAVANSGREAVALAADLRPDLVLLDLQMPGMDGYEVARRLRGGVGGAFVVAMTGEGGEAAEARSAAAGLDLHLTKPVAPEELKR